MARCLALSSTNSLRVLPTTDAAVSIRCFVCSGARICMFALLRLERVFVERDEGRSDTAVAMGNSSVSLYAICMLLFYMVCAQRQHNYLVPRILFVHILFNKPFVY